MQKEKGELEEQIKTTNDKLAKIKAYNEFFKYLNYVIEIHEGFSGWTEAEYQTARTKAQATGDQDFVDLIDWAWNEESVDPLIRIIKVLKAIVSGIESGL